MGAGAHTPGAAAPGGFVSEPVAGRKVKGVASKTKERSTKTQKAARHCAGARLFDLEMVAMATMGRRFRAGVLSPGRSGGQGRPWRASAEEPGRMTRPGRPKKQKTFLSLKKSPQKKTIVLQYK